MPRRSAPFLSLMLLALAGGYSTATNGAGFETTAPSTSLEFNVVGRADAPVTIIEFSDLQCPYCARHALNTFPQIKRNYIDTGKVRYAARDFPLAMHPFAMPAAVATRCAGEQGKFWEYRHAVFDRQDDLDAAPFDALAAELGLDVPRFAACQKDGAQADAVRADVQLAGSNGITSTPTFVVGRIVDGVFEGETFSGAKSYADFAARIDAVLAAGK
jgi:protein-disulfide isomerase